MVTSLLNAALYLGSNMEFVYLDEPMFSDPIVAAKDTDTFQALHLLMCAETGADSAYVSVARVVEWLNSKAIAANV